MTHVDAKFSGHSKIKRHHAIRELLAKRAISNQDVLRRRLAGRGIHVAQATLSRDIRELRLMKGSSGHELPDDGAQDDDSGQSKISDVLQNFCTGVRQAQNLLILLTMMGGARPTAAGVDYEEWDEVVGTVAGDSTVLIVCYDNANAEALKIRLEKYIV